MPPPPPPGLGESFLSSGISETIASVVSMSDATDAAFCSATRTTLVGSMTPAATEVLVLVGRGVVAVARPCPRVTFRAHDDRTLRPAFFAIWRSGSSSARRMSSTPYASVAVELQVVERRCRAEQRHAAAGHDAFLDRRARRVQRVLDARLLLLHLDLGRRADLDHRDAADQLREPLLQLLAVVVGRRVLDLRADLLDAASIVLLLARALDDRRVVLVDRDAAWRGRGPRASRSRA